jgi:GH15 family glucan-1,4-alpha-glucosidase
MPRPVVLGNGEILVCEDGALNIRDFYFPYVGLYNHLSMGTKSAWACGAMDVSPGWTAVSG